MKKATYTNTNWDGIMDFLAMDTLVDDNLKCPKCNGTGIKDKTEDCFCVDNFELIFFIDHTGNTNYLEIGDTVERRRDGYHKI